MVVDVASIAEGIQGAKGVCHGAVGGENVAPGIVGIGHDGRSGGIQDRRYIALEVGNVVVGGAVVRYRHGSAGIVGKVQHIASNGHLAQAGTIVDVVIRCSAVASGSPHPIGVVGVCPGSRTVGHSCQLPAMLPGIGPWITWNEILNLPNE